MNKEQLLAAAEVMRRAAEGEQVQFQTHGTRDSWRATEGPCWNWFDMNYRIKPKEPRSLFAVYDSAGNLDSVHRLPPISVAIDKITIFREVLDER